MCLINSFVKWLTESFVQFIKFFALIHFYLYNKNKLLRINSIDFQLRGE